MDKWIGPKEIIRKKEQYLLPCVYHFYKDPPQFVRGQGIHLYDHNGDSYLDFYSGVSVHALGHCHPEMVETITKQVSTLQHTTTIYLNQSIVNLAASLANFLPGSIQKSFFCSSGTEAVEGACLLATLHTGSSEFIALQHGLHGRTKLGMSLTGLSFWRTDPNPVGGITHVPNCRTEEDLEQTLHYLSETIATTTSGRIAAFIAEPIQGNGGIITPPKGYFKKVYDIVKNAGGLFIVDETQTGFGRTGYNFGIDYYEVEPDIVCGGKALGGGTPCGFFATNDKIAKSYTRPGASTFGGNPVTAEAGIKFLEILSRDNLVEESRKKGIFFEELLINLKSKYSQHVADVRGRGLMWGIELQGDNIATLVDNILEESKNCGLLVGKTGANRNVITIMPPLIVTKEQIKMAMKILEKVFDACLKSC